ncbi:MAG: chemotaxis protein CheB [Gammaproteobacteria bacterium]
MPDHNNVPLRVAIVTNSPQPNETLSDYMRSFGLNVVLNAPLSVKTLGKLRENNIDVLLVDLGMGGVPKEECIELLHGELDIPVLYNDGLVTSGDDEQDESQMMMLSQKLAQACGRKLPIVDNGDSDRSVLNADDRERLKVIDESNITPMPINPTTEKHGIADRVWVLVGSIGSINAIMQFLCRIPADFPAAFIISLKIDERILPMYKKVVEENTAFRVFLAEHGHALKRGEVIIASQVNHLSINANGEVQMYSPLAEFGWNEHRDDLMRAVAQQYHDHAGVIVFSGISHDGIDGCRAITECGGMVWVQSADSCLYKSMPDFVRDMCSVTYSDSPELMAVHLAEDVRQVQLANAV